jgi:predicted AlkP superfamily pyrophosphatase or phosphodiesterase
MPRRDLLVKLLSLGLLTLGLVRPALAEETERHVVMVSLDGLAAFLMHDFRSPIPTVRELAKSGAHAPAGMKVSNPSVTWPNHTTLITGVRPEKHGVLANGVLVRGAIGVPVFVDPKRDQSELIRVPTLLEAARAAGLRTAEINWPCVRGSQSLDDSFPDVPDAVEHMTPRLRDELIERGILADATQSGFMSNSAAGRDLIWTEAACHVIRQRKPNLMLIHLLNVDATHHAAGAQTPASYTANGYIDMCLARIVAAIDEAGIRERTTLVVVSDHGFASTPKALLPNVLLRQEGLLKVDGGKISEAQVHVYPEGGIGLVYCTNPGNAPQQRERIRKLFTGLEGVRGVLLPEEFAEHGLPHPREYVQAPDAVLVAEDGYAVSASIDGDAFIASNVEARTSLGSHGFLATLEKMNALCVFSGWGVRPGVKLEGVENIQVAPTIAQLLGLELPGADGQVLRESLAGE